MAIANSNHIQAFRFYAFKKIYTQIVRRSSRCAAFDAFDVFNSI